MSKEEYSEKTKWCVEYHILDEDKRHIASVTVVCYDEDIPEEHSDGLLAQLVLAESPLEGLIN